MGGLLIFAAAGQSLGGAAGRGQHQHRDGHDGNDDGQQHVAHLCPELHDTGRGGNEEQREDAREEQAHFLDLLQLDDAKPQGQQQ